MADILGENLPLIRRFKDPKLEGEVRRSRKLHLVYYFASKAEFVDYLSPQFGADIAENLGFYDPPKSGRRPRARLFLPRPWRADPGHRHPLSRGLAPAPLRDGRPQRLHQERRQFLGLRGARYLLRDRQAAAGRLARGRRPGRAPHGGGDQVAG